MRNQDLKLLGVCVSGSTAHPCRTSTLPLVFLALSMTAAFCVSNCDKLLQQQLSPHLQAAGLVVRNTFIDFQKPVITAAHARAQSEGAAPRNMRDSIDYVWTDSGDCRTPSLWGDEYEKQSVEIAESIHFAGINFVSSLSYSDQALIDYGLGQDAPDLTANDYMACNVFVNLQELAECEAGLMTALREEGGCLTPRLSPPCWEVDAVECENHQTTCSSTCTGCYWHTKNNSCRWGDECKFCHRCDWVRRT